MNTEIVSYNPTKAALFRERYKHLPECSGVIKAINDYLEGA